SRQPESGEISTMRRILRRLENSEPLLLVPLSCTSGDCHELRPFITWEPFALEGNAPGCFPVETGFWAFPVKTGSDYQIFQADIGMLHGLPNHDFPVKIAGRNARVCNLHTDFCEFLVNGHLPGPFPVMGFLTGGDTHAPVDLQNWKPADLKNLLAHLDHCPLYLQKNNQIIEFPA
ncbi:MAG: hypothetical protein PHD82_14510, partial [Candidatus Riflebacteria bacterium]|nr:hypothetical protein [Candidatus Riflebacteria bacterium]